MHMGISMRIKPSDKNQCQNYTMYIHVADFCNNTGKCHGR